MGEVFVIVGLVWTFVTGWIFGREHERRLAAKSRVGEAEQP